MSSKRWNGLRSPFKPLYEEAALPGDIRRSLTFILFGNICGTLSGTVCATGSTAMVNLANELGAGDLVFGILNGLGTGLALLQIFFAWLVNRTHQRKKYLLTFGLVSRFLWILVGFIPLLVPIGSHALPLISLLVLVGVSGIAGASINVCWYPWFGDLTPISIRGRWLSVRDTFMNLCSLIMGFAMAWLLDHLGSPAKYMATFGIAGVIGVLDMLCFAFVKDVPMPEAEPGTKKEKGGVLLEMLRNKPFLTFLIFWTVWCFSSALCNTYVAKYLLTEMNLTNMQFTVAATLVSAAATVLAVQYWGRKMDRFGSKPVLMLTGLATALVSILFLFCRPGTVSVVILALFNGIGAAFWCGTNLAANNLQLSATPDVNRASYIAWFSCITALLGSTLGNVAGGAFLEWLNTWCPLDRNKILIAVGTVIRVLSVLIIVPRMQNDRESQPGDMIRAMLHLKSKTF